MLKTVSFQTIQFGISTVFVYTELNVKTVLFLTIQFNIGTQFSSTQAIDKTLSGASAPGQSKPGSNGNKGIHCNIRSSSITWGTPTDCHTQDTHCGTHTRLQSRNRSILQPMPIEP